MLLGSDENSTSKTKLTFKVYFLTSGFVTVLNDNSMTLKELRDIVCSKRCLPPEQHGFVALDSIGGDFLALNLTLGEIPEGCVRLVESTLSDCI